MHDIAVRCRWEYIKRVSDEYYVVISYRLLRQRNSIKNRINFLFSFRFSLSQSTVQFEALKRWSFVVFYYYLNIRFILWEWCLFELFSFIISYHSIDYRVVFLIYTNLRKFYSLKLHRLARFFVFKVYQEK